jgi:hypothetical protein
MQDNCKKVWWADAANESAEEEFCFFRTTLNGKTLDDIHPQGIGHQMGRDLGYEVVENHDLGAGPILVAWKYD